MYWPNILQIGTAMLILCIMTLPVGFASLWITRTDTAPKWRRNWIFIPVAVIHGAIILPFFLNSVGVITGAALTGVIRVLLWMLLIAAMALVGWLKRHWSTKDTAAAPIFSIKWQQLGLIVIGLIAAIMTAAPISNYYAPASTPLTGSAARYRLSVDDWEKHIPSTMVLAIDDHFPPPNPYLPTDSHLRYYYFSYILPATAHNISGGFVSIPNSLVAQTILIAAFFPIVLFFYGREIGLSSGAALLAAFLITLVSSIDIVYMIEHYQQMGWWYPRVKLWQDIANRSVYSVVLAFIWAPQHVLGLIGAVTALRYLHQLPAAVPFSRSQLILIAQIAVVLAAVLGISSLVWFVLMAGLVLHLLLEFARSRFRRTTHAWSLLATLALSVVLSLPFLSLTTGRQQILRLFISPTIPGFQYFGIANSLFGPSTATYIADFPLQTMLDYGVVFFIGIAGLCLLFRTWRTNSLIRLWTALLIAGVFIMLAVRSEAGPHNDIAQRAASFVWILLGMAAGFWWLGRMQSRLWRNKAVRAALGLLVLLGLMTSAYEPYMLWTSPQYTPEERMELFDWLNTNLESEDVYHIKSNWLWYRHDPLEFIQHRTLLEDVTFGLLYTDANLYFPAIQSLHEGYAASGAVEASRLFRSIDLDYIAIHRDIEGELVAQSDPVFDLYFETVFETPYFLVFRLSKMD